MTTHHMIHMPLQVKASLKNIQRRIRISFKQLPNLAVLSVILFLIPVNLSGQVKKVLITDHVHLHSSSEPHFDLSQHFGSQEWTNLIRDQAISLISNSFGSADVTYYKEAGLTYVDSHRDLNFNLIDRNDADYFALISSDMVVRGDQSNVAWSPNYVNYAMVLRVRIENARGKKIFRKTVRLAFQIRRPNYLHGPGISQEDFEGMYHDALNAVFTGKSRLKKRIVRNGRNQFYEDFINESDRLTLKHKPKGMFSVAERFVNGIYQLTDEQQNVLGSVKIIGSAPRPEFTEMFDLDLSNRLRQTSKLNNSISGENLTILSGLNTNLDFEFETAGSPFPRVVVLNGKDIVGKYELYEPERFDGDFEGEKYEVIINNVIGLFELFYKDELKGVIQIGPYIKEDKGKYMNIVYFKKGLTQVERGKLLNLYFFAHIANYIELKAVEKELEDE